MQSGVNFFIFTKTFIMKNVFFAFLLFVGINGVNAQTESLKWYDDISIASEKAFKENKPMLLFFTGSDWCGWCHRLQKEVFFTTSFKEWAEKEVILVELDFPQKKVLPQNIKDQNATLQQQFAVRGYPTIWFVNITKEDKNYNLQPLNQTGYLAGGPEVWIANANSILGGGK